MSAEEWEQIKRIFASALNVPDTERDAYLKSACGEHTDLYHTIQELLENHQDASLMSSARTTIEVPVFREGEIVASRFRIVRFIARGGMGEVYEAFDERLRLRIALKTLRPELTAENDALERFQREILIARGVAHESLCRVFDYIEHRVTDPSSGRDRVVPCLTMELLDGQSLAEYLQRSRPLSISEALPLIRQVATGLEILHEHGIIHRDLKPSNIMLARRRNGLFRAVVMDFGLAKTSDKESDLFQSRNEFKAGAPYFMAPELLRQSAPSVASDIYAFGLIIDEMVTRTRAFSAKSLQALYFAKLWETPIPPRERCDELPEHWERSILRCLHPDPAGRFTSVAAAVSALEQPVTDDVSTSIPALQLATVTASREHRSASPLRRRAVVWAAVVVPSLMIVAAVTGLAVPPLNTTVEVFEIENRTNRPDYDYLCEGTTNELMRRLSQMQGVRVIPLYSTRSRAPERKPGRFALDGMLQAHGGQIRLTVNVTDNHDNSLVWSDNFDRKEITNPLALQSEIAQGTVSALGDRLLNERPNDNSATAFMVPFATRIRQFVSMQFGQHSAKSPTSSNVAFDLYMRGRHLLEENSKASTIAAIDYFKQAIEQDPAFALAHSALADAYLDLIQISPDVDLLAKARESAERAVKYEPTLAEAHASLAAVRQAEWDWPGAEQSYREALRLKPSFSRARLWYSGLIIQFGRYSEAIEQAQRAFEQDPHDRSTPLGYGLYLFFARRYPDAVRVLHTGIQSGEAAPIIRYNLGQVYAQMGYTSSGSEKAEYFRKALAEAEHVAEIERGDSPDGVLKRPSLADRMYAIFYTQAGNWGAAQPYVGRVLEDVNAGRASPVVAAWIYALQGNASRALDLLEQGAANRDGRLLYIKVNPYFERLHGEERFQNLLRQLRL